MVVRAPKTFNDAEDVTPEARKTFVELFQNSHLRKSLGVSRQPDQLSCDCREEMVDGVNLACGDDSDCINRMTSIECSQESGCGTNCRNQRFQLCEYVPVDVIRAAEKGYGLRSLGNVAPGTFVYEYTGEVVDEREYEQRKAKYAEQGIQHFYFMQLQKGEFLDATMKGALARFANHSCNPNCSIEKWVVNGRLRMGLFANRKILKGEEITFDYNADRYGSDPQKCYCGEPNCTGILGGRTQTAASHPRLPPEYVEALDLTDKQRNAWIQRLSQAKRRTNLTEDEINAECAAALVAKPVDVDSVTRVMACLAQCQERWLVEKLAERIRATSETAPQARIMRMHGYEILGGILKEWAADGPIVGLVLGTLDAWPRKTKNKIESSRIEQVVQQQANGASDREIRALAKKLLKDWSSLEMAYRIPRVKPTQSSSPPPPGTPCDHTQNQKERPPTNTSSTPDPAKDTGKSTPDPGKGTSKSSMSAEKEKEKKKAKRAKLPRGWESSVAPGGRAYFFNRKLGITRWERPTVEDANKLEEEHLKRKEEKEVKAAGDIRAQQLKRIIEQASMSQSASPSESPAMEKKPSSRSNSVVSSSTQDGGGDRTKKDELKFKETLAKYVPNWVKKYACDMDMTNQKMCSKEVIRILIEKERKHGRLEKHAEGLSEEKKEKIKWFVKEYMSKAFKKYEIKYGKKREHEDGKHSSATPKRLRGSSTATAKSSAATDKSSAATDEYSTATDRSSNATDKSSNATDKPSTPRDKRSKPTDKSSATTNKSSTVTGIAPKEGSVNNGSTKSSSNGSTNEAPANGSIKPLSSTKSNHPTNSNGSANPAEIDFDDD
ncbi:histone-lysine N-methyltransferase, H3 lysine-36 specific [Trichomonascus vanleenenianus]|uniref:histone-lysine N-methyltransferase, H3 lysine-36 specific n=1 Tax=Trichomonascus vanleenenianus TaxID=2268995 RepID=UPI003EC9FD56